jgi:hypothetical protein
MIKSKHYTNQEKLIELGISEFFKHVFYYFERELISFSSNLYKNEMEFIYEHNERTWLGILNNAICKAFPDSSTTLQEFNVYEGNEFRGRADLLVYWKNLANKEYYFLIEAKQYVEDNIDEMNKEPHAYYKQVIDQGLKYFLAEREYYKEKHVFLIPLSFGRITDKENLKKAFDYFSNEFKNDKYTDFCSLYYNDGNGVWVYGAIADECGKIII